MRARRHVRRPPDLTSLFDVLFIVVFAALIRAAAVENAAARPPAPGDATAPALPPPVAAVRQRALADLTAGLSARDPLVVRITRDGAIDAIEVDGRRIALVVPLLVRDPDPSVVVGYAGDRSPALRVCQIAAQQLGAPDLARYLVIMVPAAALDDLPEALYQGLHRDLARCRFDQHAEVALVDPTTLPPAPPAPRGTP